LLRASASSFAFRRSDRKIHSRHASSVERHLTLDCVSGSTATLCQFLSERACGFAIPRTGSYKKPRPGSPTGVRRYLMRSDSARTRGWSQALLQTQRDSLGPVSCRHARIAGLYGPMTSRAHSAVSGRCLGRDLARAARSPIQPLLMTRSPIGRPGVSLVPMRLLAGW